MNGNSWSEKKTGYPIPKRATSKKIVVMVAVLLWKRVGEKWQRGGGSRYNHLAHHRLTREGGSAEGATWPQGRHWVEASAFQFVRTVQSSPNLQATRHEQEGNARVGCPRDNNCASMRCYHRLERGI